MKGKGYYIGERAGVLERKHIEAMGQSRWLFSWAIRRQTGTTRDGWGIVLYGNDITYEAIESDLGAPIRTLQRWMSRLIAHGYIRRVLRPHGFKLFIAKPKKSREKKDAPFTGFPQSGTPQMADHGTPQMADLRARSGGPLMADHSNKSKTTKQIQEKVADHRSIKDLEVKSLRRKQMLQPPASGQSPPPKAQITKHKPTPPEQIVLGGIAAIASHKQMPRAGPLTELEFDRRRQRMKLDLQNYLARSGAVN